MRAAPPAGPRLVECVFPERLSDASPEQVALAGRVVDLQLRRNAGARRWRWISGAMILIVVVGLPLAVRALGYGANPLLRYSSLPAVACVIAGSIWLQRRRARAVARAVLPWLCPACGYFLEGLPLRAVTTCPECGTVFDAEKRRHLALPPSDIGDERTSINKKPSG